jgi:hypothetical protein
VTSVIVMPIISRHGVPRAIRMMVMRQNLTDDCACIISWRVGADWAAGRARGRICELFAGNDGGGGGRGTAAAHFITSSEMRSTVTKIDCPGIGAARFIVAPRAAHPGPLPGRGERPQELLSTGGGSNSLIATTSAAWH